MVIEKPAEDTRERNYYRKKQNNMDGSRAIRDMKVQVLFVGFLFCFVLCIKGSKKVETTDKRWIMELRCPEGGRR